MTIEQDYAVAYAQAGWPGFPLWPTINGRCACSDPECDSPGKHPISTGWPNTTPSIVAASTAWRGQLGRRGIGLPLGPRAGMWALDVDPRHGGVDALLALERDYGRLPVSLRTWTGGDGMHVLFAWPESGPPITNANGLPDGLDVRGQGGFIVLPPSMHASGQRYVWGVPPKRGRLEPAPGWLLELVRQPQRSLRVVEDRESGDDESPPPRLRPGKRHQGLVAIARDIVGQFRVLDCDVVEGALLEVNRRRCEPPLEDSEVLKIADWARHSDAADYARKVAGFADRIRRARGEAP